MRRALAVFALLAAGLVATPAQAEVAAGIDSRWAATGPNAVTVKILPAHTLYYPTNLAGRHPVVVWGNGTFAFPGIYSGLLRHLASHGFIVAAANTAFSGTGIEMRAGIDLLANLDRDASSPLNGHVDLQHIGAAGHSQGGQGAINAGADDRIDAVVALQPGPLSDASKLKGPGLFLAGTNDTTVFPALIIAQWEKADQVPAIYAALKGAGHLEPTGDGGGFRGVVTAFFKYRVAADAAAAKEFVGPTCGLCTDTTFTDVRHNSLA